MSSSVYESPRTDLPIVDDMIAEPPEGAARGLVPRDWEAAPLGTYGAPFPLPDIPESEWLERVEFLDRTKGWPVDHKRLSGFGPKDQNGTNYCWVNAEVQAVQYIRAMEGLPYVSLSPASVGAPIKSFRNVGGWGGQALEYIVDHGCVPTELWPDNAIDRRYDTPEANAERPKYRVSEWWDLEPKNFAQLATCLLWGYPVSAGYNWWGHQILVVRLVRKNNAWHVEIDNSWGPSWGDNGHGLLTRSKGTPDDANAPRVATPYDGGREIWTPDAESALAS